MTKKNINLMGEVNTIAIATDGSSYSDGAVQEAIFFGQACGAKIIALNVINTDTEAAVAAQATASPNRMEIKNYLDNIKKMADDSGIECEIIIEKSRQPDKAIVELAYKYEADVLIMGRHGRRGLLKLLAGSMTSKVIGHGFPQVLVVPKNFTIAGEKILLATDGSSFSSLAAEEAISMAKNCTTLKKTFVLSVADREDRLPKAETLAKEVCEKIKNNDINTQCVPISAVGRPSDIIANTAKKYNIDMIIMGGHGKGLTKLLMGHVTEKVIAKALCGVLVVENTNA